MFWSFDLLAFLFVPIMIITAIKAVRSWTSLWDNDLTFSDRQLLQQIVLFLLMPCVVLAHEYGHVAAIKHFGGRIAEFHYMFLAGYVIPQGTFTANERVLVYLAGNLVQAAIGFTAFGISLLFRSPPAVALLTYLSLWSTAGTAIVYALFSFTGLYGDWIHVYSEPGSTLTACIAVCHFALVTLLIWALYGKTSRNWFAKRTESPTP